LKRTSARDVQTFVEILAVLNLRSYSCHTAKR